jgi:predicted nuclease of predicted toxin-antitoxin system
LDLVADENVDAPIAAALRAAGHRIVYVQELDPGIEDDQVLDLANRSGALLLTSDKDFGERVFRQGLVHADVILYRLAGLTGERKAAAILDLLRTHGDALLGAFTLVSPAHVRIRARVPGSQ